MRIELRGVRRTYASDPPVRALRGVDLTIEQGELVAITGPSGSGKSTLLNVLALLDRPDEGEYLVDGVDVGALSESERAWVRSRCFGFVFQSFHLMDRRSLVDNAELGLVYQGVGRTERRERAARALDVVGLGAAVHKPAGRMSGGERQRVAIARAVGAGAPVIVADEPTGNLDSETSGRIMAELAGLNARGATVIVVTHDPETAAACDRHVQIRDGVVVADDRPATNPGARPVPDASDATTPSPAQLPARHRSQVRLVDRLRDAFATVVSRPGRSGALVAAVALGVGLAIATSGLADSASAQVSGSFDARQNREVTVTWQPSGDGDTDAPPPVGTATGQGAFTTASLTRARALAGVDAAAVLSTNGTVSVRDGSVAPVDVTLYGADGDLVDAAELTLRTTRPGEPALADGEALVGSAVARSLQLGPLALEPVVAIDGRTFRVVGVVTDSPRVPELERGMVVGARQAASLLPAAKASTLLHTTAGAAQQVAGQAALAVDPYEPEQLVVSAPDDPRNLREQIEGDVRVILLVLTLVAVLAATISLGNAMLVSVVERTPEFGLRRAIGARRRDITACVLWESVIVGLAGGVVGVLVAFLGILSVTLARRWIPVFDVRLVPLAVTGGVVVGMLGALLAAGRARRVEPSDALRSA